jgi:hypothetical protein
MYLRNEGRRETRIKWEDVGMIKLLFATIIAASIAAGPSQAQQTTTKDQLIGSWKVLNLKATIGDKVTYPLGEQVAGYVTITPTRIWLLFVDATRKAPAAPTLTDAEAVTMMKTQVAWTGKYTSGEQASEGIRLTAHVDAASSQVIFDTDRVYFIRVDGNRMAVRGNVIVPMTGQTSIVEFELVKSDWAERRDQGSDHADQVSLSSPWAQTAGQRRTVPVRLPTPHQASIARTPHEALCS